MTKSEKEKLFEHIIADNKDRIYRICRSWLPTQTEIPDLYQEILIGIWNAMDRFREESAWATYLYRIALNTAIRYKNNLQKKSRHLTDSEIPDVPYEDGTPEVMEKEKKLTLMHRCIQELDDHDRILITLVLEDLSYKEIADILDSNTNVVGVRINRIKKRISKRMEAYYGSF